MANRLIICAAENRPQANRLIGHLINGGFEEGSISILFSDKNGSAASPKKKRRGVSMMAKAGVGALLGGAFVWLSGTGVLSVPNLGSLIIAGAPLATALSCMNRRGVAHALETMGLSRDEAHLYEAKVKKGQILISIAAIDEREAVAAHRVVRAIGVQDIADTSAADRAFGAMHNAAEMMLQCAAN